MIFELCKGIRIDFESANLLHPVTKKPIADPMIVFVCKLNAMRKYISSTFLTNQTGALPAPNAAHGFGHI